MALQAKLVLFVDVCWENPSAADIQHCVPNGTRFFLVRKAEVILSCSDGELKTKTDFRILRMQKRQYIATPTNKFAVVVYILPFFRLATQGNIRLCFVGKNYRRIMIANDGEVGF